MKLSIDQLITSKDVVEHLKSINHEFSETEEAILIHTKDRCSYNEKIALFKEFIDGKESSPLVESIKQWFDEVEKKLAWCTNPKEFPYPGSLLINTEFEIDDEEMIAYADYHEDEVEDCVYYCDDETVLCKNFDDVIEFAKRFHRDTPDYVKPFVVVLRDYEMYDTDSYDNEDYTETRMLVNTNYEIEGILMWDEKLNTECLDYLIEEELNVPHPFSHGDIIKDTFGNYGVIDMNDYGKFSELNTAMLIRKGNKMNLLSAQYYDGVNIVHYMVSPRYITRIENPPKDFKLLSKVIMGDLPAYALTNLVRAHIWVDITEGIRSILNDRDLDDCGIMDALNLEFMHRYGHVQKSEGREGYYDDSIHPESYDL